MKILTGKIIVLLAAFIFVGCQDVNFAPLKEHLELLGVTEGSITINNGQDYTNDSDVQLSLYAKNADEMYVTNVKGCEDGGKWEAYTNYRNWKLDKENSSTKVYVRYKNIDGYTTPCVEDTITHDNVPPVVSFKRTPPSLNNEKQALFEFNVIEEVSGIKEIECTKTEGNTSKVQCAGLSSQITLNGDGQKELLVRAIDRAGNVSFPIRHKWTLDGTPPQVQLLSMPDKITRAASATFNMNATDKNGIKGVYCKLENNSSYTKCNLQQIYQNISEGKRKFSFYAVDKVGNSSPRYDYDWTVDRTPPVLSWASRPGNRIKESSAEFLVSVKESLTKYQLHCRFGNESFKLCQALLKSPEYGAGVHTVEVKAVDEAQNWSPVLKGTWSRDNAGPTLTVTKTPNNRTNKQTSRLAWSLKDDLGTVKNQRCSLDGSPVSCSNPFDYTYSTGFSVGKHSFVINSWDDLNNKSIHTIGWTTKQAVMSPNHQVDVNRPGSVDILFIVDNSSSMSAEQNNMADRIDNFLTHIDGLDWQIGVTTTDPRPESARGDGQLLTFEGTKTKVLRSGDYSYSAGETIFQNTIKIEGWGSSEEQGIRGAYRALEKRKTEAEHQQLFRETTKHLAMVVLTDEDESGKEMINQPDSLIDLVNKTWSGKKSFNFHSIIVKPGDKDCAADKDHIEGHAYVELSNKTNGIIGDVCAEDYASQLAGIGKSILKEVTKVTLKCNAYDVNLDGKPDIKIDFAKGTGGGISYYVKGNTLFLSHPLPIGKHKLIYHCPVN